MATRHLGELNRQQHDQRHIFLVQRRKLTERPSHHPSPQ
jgi:hypothetical protein